MCFELTLDKIPEVFLEEEGTLLARKLEVYQL